MRRIAFFASVVLFASAVSIATADATPPSGELTWEDYARAQVVEGANVPITGGSTLVQGLVLGRPRGRDRVEEPPRLDRPRRHQGEADAPRW